MSQYAKFAYFTSWSIYSINYKPNQIPVENLTHILYAFANIVNGEIALGDAWADVQISYGAKNTFNGVAGAFGYLNSRTGDLRTRNPNIKTLISIGGWTWSSAFSSLASTASGRQKFAKSIAAFLPKYGFDGVDIDWEYPVSGGAPGTPTSPQDGVNYVLLLQEIRNQLNAIAPNRYLLTVATSAAPNIAKNVNMRSVSDVVNYINLMSYDFAGAWMNRTSYDSNLYFDYQRSSGHSIDNAVCYYQSVGVPLSKIVLGTPFCGKVFKQVGAGTLPQVPGFNAPYNGVPAVGELPGMIEAGIINQVGVKQLTGANNPGGYVIMFDNNAKSASAFSISNKIFLTFENPSSIVAKCEYIKSKRLGGIMAWELSQDPTNTLTGIFKQQLG
ncbi:hypothetical protein BB560_002940 [Smittium megazygosporum]|uniref:GH18 domain-containing protein n=1 Tax=Smittium megazygosporum TaxID=133381 RepID=A0A2T9ZDD8_9FUNG|nr:hypothetical protein BB560_002940 [Smittium megazygosporum]